MKGVMVGLLIAGMASGCVSKSKYNVLKADYDQLMTDLETAAGSLKSCEEKPEPECVCEEEAEAPPGNR